MPPSNLLGDFAGGGMSCAMGIALALFERERSGHGQVIDAAMVDGSMYIGSFLYSLRNMGLWDVEPSGTNMLDTGAPFYDVYSCADGKHIAVGAIEPPFYSALLVGLGIDEAAMPAQNDKLYWEATRERFRAIIVSRPRAAWEEVFDGTDACVTPILNMDEAAENIHLRHRQEGGAVEEGGAVAEGGAGDSIGGAADVLPRPAPQLSRTPGFIGAAQRPRGSTKGALQGALGAADLAEAWREAKVSSL